LQTSFVERDLDHKLAIFLKKARGDMTYAQFARKAGMTPSTLFRLENMQQSITLRRLEALLIRLKCSPKTLFGD